MLQLISKSVEDTILFAKRIAKVFSAGDLIILDGNMGAGKTHFVKGILQSYEYSQKVISPTFNIANFYETKNATVLHIDLYRIENIEEFDDLGITEYFDNSVVFIEWGKKIAEVFEDYMLISIEHDKTNENQRKINILAKGLKYKQKVIEISKGNF